MFDVFIVTRTNIDLGIPDKVAFIFGCVNVLSLLFFLVLHPDEFHAVFPLVGWVL